MKVFVTGVGGQLGHDVMNEVARRGHESIGSDIQKVYSGIADDTEVTVSPYVQLDITDKDAVSAVIEEIRPDAIIHCAAWTAVDLAEDDALTSRRRPERSVADTRLMDGGGIRGVREFYPVGPDRDEAEDPVNGGKRLV